MKKLDKNEIKAINILNERINEIDAQDFIVDHWWSIITNDIKEIFGEQAEQKLSQLNWLEEEFYVLGENVHFQPELKTKLKRSVNEYIRQIKQYGIGSSARKGSKVLLYKTLFKDTAFVGTLLGVVITAIGIAYSIGKDNGYTVATKELNKLIYENQELNKEQKDLTMRLNENIQSVDSLNKVNQKLLLENRKITNQ